MGLYETIALGNGLIYFSLYPLLVFAPKFLYKFILLGANFDKYYNEESVKEMAAVFLMLAVVITPSYITAGANGLIGYIDVSIVQRITVVFASVLITGLVIDQDVFEYGNFSYTMFAVADVVPGIMQGLVAPEGYNGIMTRISKTFRSVPPTPFKKELRLESYMGMVFGFIACIYAAVVSDVKQSLVATMIATILPYFWIWCLAHEAQDFYVVLTVQRFAISGLLFYFSEVLDYGVMNVVYKMQAVNILVGVVAPKGSAFLLGLGSLFLYKLECDYVLTLESGPKWHLVGCGIMTVVLSRGWKFLFYSGYNEKQKKRMEGTFFQDNLLCVFQIVVGGALSRADYLASGTLGGPVVYLLPPATFWMSMESKLLTHLWVGTPFHPTWWMYGSSEPDQVPRYAPSDWINITFSVATVLITAVLTSYAWFVTNLAVGFDANDFTSANTWKFAVSHGILFIYHSGMWMIIASSGIPQLGNGPVFDGMLKFPPELPALLQCDPKICIYIHKIDLVLGHILLFLGAFYLGDGSNTESPEGLVTKFLVAVSWAFSIGYKLYIHSQHRLESIPYFEEQKEKETAEEGKKAN